MTRCLMVGGGGFIGTNLAKALQENGLYVRVFSRSKPSVMPAGVEWIRGDVSDASLLLSSMMGCDLVIHLAGGSTPGGSNLDKVSDLKSSLIPTIQLLEACRACEVSKVIFASSGGTVYGPSASTPIPETCDQDPISAYGIAKLAGEKYFNLFHHLYGLDYSILRIANPYGPHQVAAKNQGVISAFLHNVRASKPLQTWGDGNVVRDYLYIDDLVQAFMAAISYQGSERIFNIGSGHGASINQIVEIIERTCEGFPGVEYLPARKVDVPVNVLDISRARSELGWNPAINLSEGIGRYWHWLNRGG